MESKVSNVLFEGRTSFFHYDNASDHIQGFHRRGEFYESRQLEFHRDLIPMQSTVLDIGANIGNHTIFYAMHTWAGIVYPFEPNPSARALLQSSIAGNSDYRSKVNTDYIEYALGRTPAALRLIEPLPNNLGGASFDIAADSEAAAAHCIRLDDLNLDGEVSFLKIDVEGMELDVLAGGADLIRRFRPSLAVEISARHESPFWSWIAANNYQVANVFFDYLYVKNYLLIPRS